MERQVTIVTTFKNKHNMGAEQSKCKCLYLPAQSGKTRKMEELIKEHKLGELF
jgi:hypothetical protein